MSAESRVFAMPELLEAILLHLPLVDVLLAQRVDRTFRDGIKTSPSLQKALFLRPHSDYSLQLLGSTPPTDNCLSHLNCNIDEEVSTAPKRLDCEWVRKTSEGSGKICGAVLNPFLEFISRKPNARNVSFQSTWCYEADASWRHMLLTQPPVQNIIVDTSRANHWHNMSADKGCPGVTFTNLQRTFDAFKVVPRHGMHLFRTERFEIMPIDSTAGEMLEGIQNAVDLVAVAKSKKTESQVETEDDEED